MCWGGRRRKRRGRGRGKVAEGMVVWGVEYGEMERVMIRSVRVMRVKEGDAVNRTERRKRRSERRESYHLRVTHEFNQLLMSEHGSK